MFNYKIDDETIISPIKLYSFFFSNYFQMRLKALTISISGK